MLYKTDIGCKRWFELCDSPKYSFYTKSYNNLHDKVGVLTEAIYQNSRTSELDYISLGVGNGAKDSIMIGALLANIKSNEILYYYPMDINIMMIEKAAHRLAAEKFSNNIAKLKIKPFVGDYLGINTLKVVYDYRQNPNLFSVLGNTIGNGDERELFMALKAAVSPGDFVIFEVNCDQSGEYDVLSTEENRNHDVAPLVAADYEFDITDLKYRNINGVGGEKNIYSIVTGTLSTIATCKVKEKRNEQKTANKKDVLLSVVHHYDIKKFVTEASAQLEMEIIYENVDNGIGIVVLYKR